MAGWDYYIYSQEETTDADTQAFLMNMRKDDGREWELVTLRVLDDGRVRYYFKKPRP